MKRVLFTSYAGNYPEKIIQAIEEYFYSGCQKTFRYLNAFSTTTYTAIPYFRTYL